MLLLVGAIGTRPVLPCERPVDIQTDLEGQYYLVDEGGFPDEPVVVDKRVWSTGVYYVKREFHCADHAVRYLGEGDSIEAMEASSPEPEALPIEPGSIADQLARILCPPAIGVDAAGGAGTSSGGAVQ